MSFGSKHSNCLYYTKELPTKLQEGSILDIETTGMNSKKDEIITLGVIEKSTLTIYQRRKEIDCSTFHRVLKEVINGLSKPLFAYKLQFEHDFIKQQLGVHINGNDLMEKWGKKADEMNMKWPKLDELVSHPREYYENTNEKITGKHIPILWRKYLETGDKETLDRIVLHNERDLLKELFLLIEG